MPVGGLESRVVPREGGRRRRDGGGGDGEAGRREGGGEVPDAVGREALVLFLGLQESSLASHSVPA